MGVYENCKLYGPYKASDNRLRVILIYPDKTRKTVSYPKYLMEVHLNRYFSEDETVDHIDGNPLNNDISNLRVLPRSKHCSLDVIRNKDINVTCSYCGKEFIIPGSKVNNRNRRDRNHSGYFCSKSCIGKYSQEIKSGQRKSEKPHEKIIPEKYKAKSALEEIPDVEVG